MKAGMNPHKTREQRISYLENEVRSLTNHCRNANYRIKQLEIIAGLEKRELEKDVWLEIEDDPAIAKFSHDGKNLMVAFTKSDCSYYLYRDVPIHLFQHMIKADSKIKFLNQYIKDQFEFEKIKIKGWFLGSKITQSL